MAILHVMSSQEQISKPLKPNKRYGWVDYAKGIAIFLVVYRHVFEGLKRAGIHVEGFMGFEYANIIFFSFRMPLFFIVSGIFVSGSLAKRGFVEFTSQKSKTLLYPYFLWAILQISFQIIFSAYVNANRSWVDYTYLLYSPRRVDQFWYLYALFNVSVLYAFTLTFLKVKTRTQIFAGLIMYFFSAWTEQKGWDMGFVHEILHYYIFLALGDYLASYFKNEKSAKIVGAPKTLLLFIPIFVAAQLYFLLINLKHDPEKYRFIETYQPFMFLVIALAGCAFMLSISFLFQNLKIAPWLRVIGFHSLYIYVTHVFVASATRILLTKVAGINYLPIVLFICIGLSVLLPILFYRFCMKRGWFFFFTLENPALKK